MDELGDDDREEDAIRWALASQIPSSRTPANATPAGDVPPPSPEVLSELYAAEFGGGRGTTGSRSGAKSAVDHNQQLHLYDNDDNDDERERKGSFGLGLDLGEGKSRRGSGSDRKRSVHFADDVTKATNTSTSSSSPSNSHDSNKSLLAAKPASIYRTTTPTPIPARYTPSAVGTGLTGGRKCFACGSGEHMVRDCPFKTDSANSVSRYDITSNFDSSCL
jgi:hypothetical protein